MSSCVNKFATKPKQPTKTIPFLILQARRRVKTCQNQQLLQVSTLQRPLTTEKLRNRVRTLFELRRFSGHAGSLGSNKRNGDRNGEEEENPPGIGGGDVEGRRGPGEPGRGKDVPSRNIHEPVIDEPVGVVTRVDLHRGRARSWGSLQTQKQKKKKEKEK